MKKPTKKESKPMKLEVKKINTKQYKSKEEWEKNHNKVEVKKIRRKQKTWPKEHNKIEKAKKQNIKNWREIALNDDSVQKFLLGRPKAFKSPEEMEEQFNYYILSCLEKVKKSELVPIKTEEKEDDFLAELTEAAQANKSDAIKINNTLVTNYEITEEIKRKKIPSIWGFLIFCWWISYDTWENYKKDENFIGIIKGIQNYIESVLTENAVEWKVNPKMAEFVLNTHYNRVPKSKSEEVIKTDPIDVSELIQN